MQGKFIVFEGCDFTGKSTQITLLGKHLEKQGIKYITTREPGGVPFGEEIRKLIMSEGKKVHKITELLLFMAARSEHLFAKIIPTIENGTWVLCDRFIPSTIVYQGILGGLEIDVILKAHELLFGNNTKSFFPDLILIFDMQPKQILERMTQNYLRGFNSYDSQNLEQITKIRDGYLTVLEAMQTQGENCKKINANQPKENVLADIISAVSSLI
jgi:dTMP kinase